MAVRHKKEFAKGIFMTISFVVILFIMFSPIFDGQNAFRAADRLFNSISKGSSYYIPSVQGKVEKARGQSFQASVSFPEEQTANKARVIFTKAGAEVWQNGNELKVSGMLGQFLNTAVQDADAMFYNRGNELAEKYGMPEREAMFVWWSSLKGIAKDLTKQKNFEQAGYIHEVMSKAVEVSYNYYGIEPQSAYGKAGILTFALVFYIFYTMWWGFGILFLFEGVGLKMKAGAKKEV